MPNRNYQRGRAFEYRVKYYLEKLGYYVVRSYASKGLFDLVAIAPRHVSTMGFDPLLIQCKTNGYVPPAEMFELCKASTRYNGIVMIAAKDPRGHITFKELDCSV